MIGPHLLLEAYGCDRAMLEDDAGLARELAALGACLGLRPLRDPYVYRFAGKTPEDWGVSGIILLKSGRLSVHTFPQTAFLSLDLFTGEPFDLEATERFIRERFRATHVETRVRTRDRERLADAP